MPELATLIVIIASIVITILIMNFLGGKKDNSELLIQRFYSKIDEIKAQTKEEISIFREEVLKNARNDREELLNNFEKFSNNAGDIIAEFGNRQDKNLKDLNSKFDTFSEKSEEKAESLRTQLRNNLSELSDKNESKIKALQEKIDSNLGELRKENSAQLDKMRETVDEKLQKTLNSRISESFKVVSERLEQVHKGLGEMQNLATGVGDLKKVLNNVKTKGILGEYQLGNLLESLLAPSQFGSQLKIAPNSSKIVDFGVILPGKQDNSTVILPIDSKFPSTYYFELVEAYETGDLDLIAKNQKLLKTAVKNMAKDISEKYIEPPYTTDFAVMFLPIEGLFAEVLRDPVLFDEIQRDHKIILTGPTTLAALLNSLQMGFRTLAIEAKSADINKVLQSVKKEFEKFGGMLEKTQDYIQKAGKNVDQLLGTRTRAIERKLRDIEIDEEEDFQEFISDNPTNLFDK